MYSDSHDEAATALSLKDDHEMGVCQEVKIQPPRDANVSLSPAQSESMYPTRRPFAVFFLEAP